MSGKKIESPNPFSIVGVCERAYTPVTHCGCIVWFFLRFEVDFRRVDASLTEDNRVVGELLLAPRQLYCFSESSLRTPRGCRSSSSATIVQEGRLSVESWLLLILIAICPSSTPKMHETISRVLSKHAQPLQGP